MVTIGMNYKVRAGKGEIFSKAFASVIEVMKEIEGHGETHLFQDVLDGSSYLIISEWNTEEAFNGFIRSERFATVTNWGKENILLERPQHRTYRHEE